MDDLSFILLGVAVVVGLPAMAIAAFVMVLRLKARVTALERKVDVLAVQAARTGAVVPPVLKRGLPIEPPTPGEAEPVPEPDQNPEPVLASDPELAPEPRPELAAAAMAPARPRKASLEEQLGARWAVWVGGLALALGGVFLVRYSIEAGLIGPGMRVALGLVFSLGLVAAGEFLRRRRPAIPDDSSRAVDIPGIVTAAGTTALFATVYAAHALYGMIGPGTAFVALGLVGVATLFAAALHGPWLAGLGLVGAYATPVLVSSDAPSPWALATYLVVVTAAAYSLARVRLWRWLAIAASVAAIAWGFVMVGLGAGDDPSAPAAYVLVLAGLIVAILVVDPHRGGVAANRFDGLALGTLAAIGALALFFAVATGPTHLGLTVALLVAAAMLAVALAFDAVAPAAGIAAMIALGLLVAWPIAQDVAAEPFLVVPGHLALQSVTPDALMLYLAVALVAGLALFAATTASLLRRGAIAVPPGAAFALAGAFGPLALLACIYLRTAGLGESVPFGAVAVIAGATLAYTADRLLKIETGSGSAGHGAAGSVHVAGAAAALALALTMLMAGSPLTLAFALGSLACAWISARRPLAALRWSAAAFAILVMLRLGGTWTVLGEALTSFPGWGDILLRHAVPAVALYWGGVLLRRRAVDTPAAILDGAAIVLGTVAAALAIRLWVRGPVEAMAGDIGLVEAGLYVALAFGMATGLARGALTTTSPVHRALAPVAAICAAVLAALGPVLALDPLMTGEDVVGGVVVNSLILGYALPALLAAAAAFLWERIARAGEKVAAARPIARIIAATALVLAFLYVTLETRVLVSGPDMSFADIPTAESYAYSAVWLGFGIVLLALGLVFRSKDARLGSAFVIMLAVAKVFLVDMSDLEGVWRALSFIGLGAVLIGIGLVYQRLLFGKGGESPPPQTA